MINVSIDNESLKMLVDAIGNVGKQARFAAANALNRTGEEINARMRREIPSRFTIREQKLLTYLAPVQLPKPYRATKQNLNAILQTDGLANILGPFEAGTPKVGSAAKPIIIPTSRLRPSRKSVVPRSLYPTNLGLIARKDPSGKNYYALGRNAIRKGLTPYSSKNGVVQIKGKLGTFVLDPTIHKGISEKQWGVYQRLGGEVRMIWRYINRVSRPSSLQFVSTAAEVMADRFDVNFTGALEQALRTAK